MDFQSGAQTARARGRAGRVLVCVVALGCLVGLGATALAGPTSSEQARSAALGWIRSDTSPLGAMLGQDLGDVQTFSDEAGGPIYYIVNLKPAGFVVVPADDWVEPIIAFVAEGTYDPSDDHPLGALVTKDVTSRVLHARSLQVANAVAPPAAAKWVDLIKQAEPGIETGLGSVSDVWVAPLVQSRWNQGSECSDYCYNYYTPNHYPAGCVATALAQVLRYHEWPTAGIGVRSYTIYVDGVSQTAYTRGGDGSGGPYPWSLMMLDPTCSITPAQRQAIGALCYDAGVTVNMSYRSTGSGASTFETCDALVEVFGYSNGIKGYNSGNNIGAGLEGMINPNLDAGKPCLLAVSRTGGGHAVIADGYGYSASTLYHHINMGWGGADDAWYNLPTIDAYYTYTSVDGCVYNVFTTGAGEIISGRVTDMGGTPLSGATVTAQRTGGGTYTDTSDSRGVYALVNVPSGSTFNVFAVKAGYTFAVHQVTTGTSSDYIATSGNRWGIDFASTTGHPPQAEDADVSTDFNVPLTVALPASDDGLPNPPMALTYIIKSLPAHGALSLPGGGAIASAPYSLPGGGNGVVYAPAANYVGADSFTFTATDGGTPPTGGESNVATVSITVTPCSTGTIGTGTGTWGFPLFTYYHDSRTQVIYRASEVGQAGSISALALNVTAIPGQVLNNWTIRIKHTTLNSYSTPVLEASGWTVVYQGNEPPGSTGWRTFTFTTPFDYDGASNLMIDFSHNNDDWSSEGLCAVSTPGGKRSAYSYSDSENGDPLTWSGVVSGSSNVPNIRLTVCAAATPPAAPSGLGCGTQTTSSITWTWTDNSSDEDGFRGHDPSNNEKWTAAADAASAVESGLTANTQYSRHVHAYNAVGESEASNTASAYTLPAAPAISSSHTAQCPALPVNTTLTFFNTVGFAAGGVNHYHYVWNQSPTYTLAGSESAWSGGALQRTAGAAGSWYLHLLSHNAEHASGGTTTLGPFVVMAGAGGGYAPGDYDQNCHVDAADLEGFLYCSSGPDIPLTPECAVADLDGDNDLDQTDFAIFQRCWSGDQVADPACGQ